MNESHVRSMLISHPQTHQQTSTIGQQLLWGHPEVGDRLSLTPSGFQVAILAPSTLVPVRSPSSDFRHPF